MKKISILFLTAMVVVGGLKAQHLSINAFGGYTFNDKVDFSNAYAQLNGGFMWGVSLEGVNAEGNALELLYQYQSTKANVYSHINGTDELLNPDKNSATVSYLLLNGIRYFQNGGNVEPYFGLGLGAAFMKSDASTSSSTSFAWDVKTGIKIKAGHSVGFKLGAQLLSSLHQNGTDYYYYNGVPYAYQSYGNIWQFGFTGGIYFNLGH